MVSLSCQWMKQTLESSLIDSIPFILCLNYHEILFDLPSEYIQNMTTSHHLHSYQLAEHLCPSSELRIGPLDCLPVSFKLYSPHSGQHDIQGLRWSISPLCLSPPLGLHHTQSRSQTMSSRALWPNLQLTPHSISSNLTASLLFHKHTKCSCLYTCSSFFQEHSCPKHPCTVSHVPQALFKCHLSLDLPWSSYWKVHTFPFPHLFSSTVRIIIEYPMKSSIYLFFTFL